MPNVLSALAILFVGLVLTQTETDTAETSANHLFYALRLVGALLAATVVPLVIDRRARHSSRVSQ